VDHAGSSYGAFVHFPETFFLSKVPIPALTHDKLARLESIGHSLEGSAWLFRPERTEEIPALFYLARKHGLTVALRGAGRSYGDAAMNNGQLVLDLTKLTRVLKWDAQRGRITVEPGVTIEQLWKHVLADGWWPPVVSGTMYTTLGGCLAANIHGKNNWRAGPIGEHVVEFEALLPSGKTIKCSPRKNADLFHAMISGMGLLGVFTSITLQLKQLASGNVEVHAWTETSLERMLTALDEHKTSDYVVGWVDCIARGRGLGRGQMHTARYLEPGEDADPERSLRVEAQRPRGGLLGLVPKRLMPLVMAPFANNLGTWGVNTAKYWSDRFFEQHRTYRQSLAAFNFLLDYFPIPDFGGTGFIQYQSFIPEDAALDTFTAMLQLCQRAGLPSYAGVLKRHRPDAFLFSHAVDGYSLALDFRVTPRNRQRLVQLASKLDKMVLAAGGRFYFAKDSTLTREVVASYLGAPALSRFRKLKRKVDPHNLLQTDLYRRCLA
jgi:decaprenylphospho-beta-D-ribofuranose 2-oxidase